MGLGAGGGKYQGLILMPSSLSATTSRVDFETQAESSARARASRKSDRLYRSSLRRAREPVRCLDSVERKLAAQQCDTKILR